MRPSTFAPLLSLALPAMAQVSHINIDADTSIISAAMAIEMNTALGPALEAAMTVPSVITALAAIPTTDLAAAAISGLEVMEGAVTGSEAPAVTSAVAQLTALLDKQFDAALSTYTSHAAAPTMGVMMGGGVIGAVAAVVMAL